MKEVQKKLFVVFFLVLKYFFFESDCCNENCRQYMY